MEGCHQVCIQGTVCNWNDVTGFGLMPLKTVVEHILNNVPIGTCNYEVLFVIQCETTVVFIFT